MRSSDLKLKVENVADKESAREENGLKFKRVPVKPVCYFSSVRPDVIADIYIGTQLLYTGSIMKGVSEDDAQPF